MDNTANYRQIITKCAETDPSFRSAMPFEAMRYRLNRDDAVWQALMDIYHNSASAAEKEEDREPRSAFSRILSAMGIDSDAMVERIHLENPLPERKDPCDGEVPSWLTNILEDKKGCTRMYLREALFFSKSGVVCYSNKENKYVVRVRETVREEENTWLIGPSILTRHEYTVQVSDSRTGPAYKSFTFHDIDSCEEFLRRWCIDTDERWEVQDAELLHERGERICKQYTISLGDD